MTAVQETKWLGYSSGGVALLLLFVLRYFPRRRSAVNVVADPVDTTSRL